VGGTKVDHLPPGRPPAGGEPGVLLLIKEEKLNKLIISRFPLLDKEGCQSAPWLTDGVVNDPVKKSLINL